MPRKTRANYFNFSGGLDSDASPLNRNPVTVTDIDNCTLSLDGSISSRKGMGLLADSVSTEASGETQEYPIDALNVEFQYTSGTSIPVPKQFQVVQSKSEMRIYTGDASLMTATPLLTTSILTPTEGLGGGVKFDGKYIIQASEVVAMPSGIRTSKLSLWEFNGTTWAVASGPDNLTYRKYNTLTAIKEPDTAWQSGGANTAIHPFQPSQTTWTSGAYTGVPDYDFNSAYVLNDQVKVERGVLRVTDLTGASALQIGAAIRLNKTTGSTYDRIKEVELISGTYYRVVLENLSDTEGLESVSVNIIDEIDESLPVVIEPALGRAFIVTSINRRRVYFSQIYTEDINNINKYHTDVDPYDPVDNSVVASDGGFFDISGIGEIYDVKESAGSIIILADNGVWEAVGSGGLFRADDFVVRQLSDKGCVGKAASSRMENGIAYASNDGINFISKDAQTALTSVVKSLTDNRLQSYIVSIPKDSKKGMKLRYNKVNKELYVLHNDTDTPATFTSSGYPVHYRKMAVYSLNINAWYIWSLSTDTDWVKLSIFDIWMSDYDVAGTTANKVPMVVYARLNDADTNIEYQYGRLYTDDECDFDGTTYEECNTGSFTSAHQTYGDIMRGKNANYIKVLYEDTGATTTDAHGWNVPLGGCRLRSAIDFADDPVEVTDAFGQPKNSNVAYGTEYEIYPTEDSGFSHHMYKHKLLGRGNVLQYTFNNYLKERWFKCVSAHTGESPILDTAGTYWEEVTEAEYTSNSGAAWAVGTAYVIDDYVDVTKITHFKIVGWSCELIPTESLTTG